MAADRRKMRLQCAQCGQTYMFSDNIGTLQCSITVTIYGETPIKIRTCHIDGTYDAAGSLTWTEALHRLGKFASIPSFAVSKLTTKMAPEAVVDPDEHNAFLLSYLNDDMFSEIYAQLKIPDTNTRELVSLVYYYQFDWKRAIPIILKTRYLDVIQASQPTRYSYFNVAPTSEHVYDTYWYKNKLTPEERQKVALRLR